MRRRRSRREDGRRRRRRGEGRRSCTFVKSSSPHLAVGGEGKTSRVVIVTDAHYTCNNRIILQGSSQASTSGAAADGVGYHWQLLGGHG